MCTAVSFITKDHYFGRNLDYDFSYQESVVITPRNYSFIYKNQRDLQGRDVRKVESKAYAMIGMAYVVDNYPLYYDAVNEAGLGMAGLLFTGNAMYCSEIQEGNLPIASFEFIPWILRQCSSVEEARKQLKNVRIMDWAFSKDLPPSPLHWMIADRNSSLVVEAVEEGLKIYDNPVHVLTNNPDFEYHLTNLNNYMDLSPYEPENSFADRVNLDAYSRGMGAIGLPGDLSSASRFVRGAFTRMNSICGGTEEESVSQFFHILGSVEQQRGSVRMRRMTDGKKDTDNTEDTASDETYEITIYSCCCNTDAGIYYYKTYDNHQITAVDMHRENLEEADLKLYPLVKNQQINYQN